MGKYIPDGARSCIINKLISIGEICGGMESYEAFFERVYPEAKEVHCENNEILLRAISRHCDYFPEDWGDEFEKFKKVGVYEWTDEQFLFFCKEYVNPIFRRCRYDEDTGESIDLQPQCVEVINFYLRDCGYELKEANRYGDKVEYKVEERFGVRGKIQEIVFAAVAKPEFLITDVLNQDITIPLNNKRYLIYNGPIEREGLKWKQLKEWYDDTVTSCEESFEERIERSVGHGDSVLEKNFYKAYLELVTELGEDIPALLPQVYLYYDPKVQKERIIKIFDHQCMDFLMIFSESRRIIIELDGVQHYAEDEATRIPGRKYEVRIASTQKYADMVKAQREMTLAGYEVYRFGGSEIYEWDNARNVIKCFLKELFCKYGMI